MNEIHAPTSIRERIYQMRQRREMSVEELAERSELDAATIEELESGERKPSSYVLGQLADALTCDVATLLGVESTYRRAIEALYDIKAGAGLAPRFEAMFGPLKAAETLERPEIWEVYNHSEAQQMAERVGIGPASDDEYALRALYAVVSGQVALRAVDTFLPGLDAAAIEALSELRDEAVTGDLN